MKAFAQLILGILVSVAIVYFIWALFIPMAIGGKVMERKVIEQSPQFVMSQKRALQKMQTDYTIAEGPAKTAIQTEMCSIAGSLNRSDVPENISSYVKGCAK